MKNNIEYYQHFCIADQHPKFKMLRVKYGWAGEGKFWALNNRIGLADNCRIDLNKKYNKGSLANDLDFSLNQFDEFIEYLESECCLIIKENGFITTEMVSENLESVMRKRKRNKTDYCKKIKDTLRNIKTTETEIQTSENIQSKVKESRVKESRVNNTKEVLKKFSTISIIPKDTEINKLLELFTLENVFKIIDRAGVYWKRENKTRKFRLKKRWSSLIGNISIFDSDEGLKERIESEIKWEKYKKEKDNNRGSSDFDPNVFDDPALDDPLTRPVNWEPPKKDAEQ